MNIFALPDLFLRKLMKKVELKDRLTLRLTCRAFEELVAETDAGHFYEARFTSCDNDHSSERCLSVKIGFQARFKGIMMTKDGLDQFLNLRNRLFNRISLAHAYFEFVDHTFPLDFVLKFCDNVKIGELHFRTDTESNVKKSLQLIETFPSSKYAMTIYSSPNSDLLQLLPPMERLEILPREAYTEFIPASSFFELLAAQDSVYFGLECVTVTSDEWKTGMQMFPGKSRMRVAQFFLKCSTVVGCLRNYGISQTSKSGDFYGEFEVISCEGPADDVTVHFRYGRCWTRIQGLEWAGVDSHCPVTMETNDYWQ